MSYIFIKFLFALPIGGFLIWLAKKVFSPTFEELGNRLKSWIFTVFGGDEHSTYVSYSNIHKSISELHTKNGHNLFYKRKPYLNDHSINLEIKSKTKVQLSKIATLWIKQLPIDSYDESNIFFAGLELLLPNLTKEHIQEIYEKHCDNDQANLWVFLENVEKQRQGLITSDILKYVHKKRDEYEKSI